MHMWFLCFKTNASSRHFGDSSAESRHSGPHFLDPIQRLLSTQSRRSQMSPTPHQGGPIDGRGRSRWQFRPDWVTLSTGRDKRVQGLANRGHERSRPENRAFILNYPLILNSDALRKQRPIRSIFCGRKVPHVAILNLQRES